MIEVKDRTAVVGVGRTRSDRDPATDPVRHVALAVRNACEDAGLTLSDIDGIMVNLAPEAAAMDQLPTMVGLPNVRWAFQSWFHGRIQPTCISAAVWAVLSGQANYVACISVGQSPAAHHTGFAERWREKGREGGGAHLESPPYGLVSAGGGAALAWQRYLSKYGGDPNGLGEVAVAQREWAQLQPDAYFNGRPLTTDDYLASPFVVEPLRVLDHCLPANAAFCIIVAAADRASSCRKEPVFISGLQGSSSGREHFIFSRTGLGVAQQTDAPYVAPDMPVYTMAGISRDDVDVLGSLDAFSPVVVFTLEEFGFCREGETLDWLADQPTRPGGALPVNTCGGGLSDVESFGWGHTVGLVRQLRGEAGDAQVAGARVAQYACPDRSSIVYTVQ